MEKINGQQQSEQKWRKAAKRTEYRGARLILVITLIAVTVMNNMVRKNQTQELGYEEFVEYLKEGEIDTAKISSNRIYLTPKTSSTKLSRFIQYYTVRIPDVDLAERLLDANGVHVVAEDTSTSASILNF